MLYGVWSFQSAEAVPVSLSSCGHAFSCNASLIAADIHAQGYCECMTLNGLAPGGSGN